MFVFCYIVFYLILILVMLGVHFLITNKMNRYEKDVEIGTYKWDEYINITCKADNHVFKSSIINRLKKPAELKAFFIELDKRSEEEKHIILLNNKQEIIKCIKKSNNNTLMAYFAYLISQANIYDNEDLGEIIDYLMELIKGKSVFVRENALKAIYSFKDPMLVNNALRWISDNGVYHNRKLIIDGLNSYTGDREELCLVLCETIENFRDRYKKCMIMFFSLCKWQGASEKLKKMFAEDNISVDTRCSIVRYFGQVLPNESKDMLLNTLDTYSVADDVSPAIVASSFLGHYEGDKQVVDTLLKHISSSNWYVRMNCAKALVKCKISQVQIDSILNGNDKFAKDALEYMINVKVD